MKIFMRKILSLILACCCIFPATACNDENDTNSLGGDTPPISCTHSYACVTTKEATCKETGVKTHTCGVCGDSYTEDIEKTDHDYVMEVVRPSSCVTEGINSYMCSDCGYAYTEEIPKLLKHEYDSEVTKEATCGSYGVTTYTCINCGDSYTQRIDKTTEHNYTSEIKKTANCLRKGIIRYTCNSCGDYYEEEIPQSTEHNLTKNNVCRTCGLGLPIAFESPTQEEQTLHEKNLLLRTYDVTTDNKGNYIFSIRISTENNNDSSIPFHAVLDIAIKNTNNEIVYSLVKEIKPDDFQLTNGEYIYKEKIHYSELSKITTKLDKLYSNVYVPQYCSWNEKEKTMPALIILPTLPDTIYEYDNNDRLLTGVKITDISYTVNTGSYSDLYFTGEKTYDKEGELYSRRCSIGYKLYDSEDYLIDSGVYTTNALKVGEKFKNGREFAFYELLEAGRIYRLEILNVG